MNATQAGRRRGAMLLLVLGVLMLFLLMGTTMLTLATRTRTTARAFAAATAGQAARPLLARHQLDQAVLALLRGGPDAAAAGLSESLLADMYGAEPPLAGRVTSLTVGTPIVVATVEITGGSAAGPVRAADLCGRVITFTPEPESGDALTSMRIMRASGTGPFTCWIARLQPDSETVLPRVPCDVLVNQPAFLAEAYDAYDSANPWLTKVALQDGNVTSVPRPAFATAGASVTVDNDNDGVKDGVWLEGIFDSLPAPGGGRLEFDASYLVLDLDGRVNVNAHGNRTSIENLDWSGAPDVPTGSGYGPADIDASRVFVDPGQPPSDPPVVSDRWRRIVGEPPASVLSATSSTTDQRRPVPLVGTVEGRYGASTAPGLAGNDTLSRRNELLYGDNPLVDLKCMIKVQIETIAKGNSESIVPKMVYYCPDWTKAGYTDDPYEMRLGIDAPRPCELRSGISQIDNPFTLADMEAVLRQFDTDATTLSPRLAVALDDASQRSRMLVTTDSWDTPGLTGSVAKMIADYIAGLQCDPATVMSPDVLAGLRFDINRPFPTGTGEAAAKQDFCKHLFTLLVALGRPANAATAQWAANVVDYRDPDAKFTRFQFDADPTDGWGQGTNGWSAQNMVWGLERPELVIAQTIAYYVTESSTTAAQDGLYVSLFRPSWTEQRTCKGNGNTPVIVSTTTAPVLDLAEKSSQSSQPVWRLRIEPGTSVRFDAPGSGEKEVSGVFRKTGGAKDAATVAPDSYLVVMPTPPKVTGNQASTAITVPVDNSFKKFEINSGGTFKATSWPGAASYQSGADTIVFLERLEDPASPWNDDPTNANYNPYVILDRMGIKRVNRMGENANNWKTYIRESSLWNNGPFETTGNCTGMVPLAPLEKSWLPWANRAFISHAELVLVPQGNGAYRYWDYKLPKNKRDTNPYYELPTPHLLDAAIVPSRFVGSQVSFSPTSLATVGMDKIPFNQLSRWREPGRVNLNTVLPNRNCDDPQQVDAVWWAAMGPDALVALDEFTAGGPAKSIRDLLTLMQGDAIYIDSAAASGIKGNSWKKNRSYDLNPMATYATAIRLANVATVRSHMFAVWVTLRVRDTSPGGGDSYHRAFAIIDRSRPVGFAAGRDLNVRDTIRVLRFLE